MRKLIKNIFNFKKLEIKIFGDNINTDQLHSPSKFSINKDTLRLDYIDSKNKTEADSNEGKEGRSLLIIAGYNFGIGSSRFSTPLALKNEGVKCVAALSISRIFERNLAAAGIFALTILKMKHKAKVKTKAKAGRMAKLSGGENANNSGIKTADLFGLFRAGREIIDETGSKSSTANIKIKADKVSSKIAAAEININAGGEIISLTAGMDMFLYEVAASGGMVNYVANKRR